MPRSEAAGSAAGTPVVSILLPSYNAALTLGSAITSVLAQQFTNWELLVLDDHSRDGTPDLVTALCDARVRYIGPTSERGLVARLNQGIALARGRYIARMDADDVSFPLRLGRQVAFLDAHPDVDLVGCKAVAFREDGAVLGILPFAPTHEALCKRPWSHIPLPHPGWMGRRAWFERHLYRPVPRAEDQELLLRAYPVSRFACLDEVLLGYRLNAFRLSSAFAARRSLLRAQLRIFFERRELLNGVRAAVLACAKMAADVACAAGFEKPYMGTARHAVSAEVLAQLNSCLSAGASTKS
ncbi:MAG: glycosyltransferase family 2 protein [Rhodospirillaceae bacterium]